MIQQIKIWNSRKQHAFSIMIRSNQYIQLDYTTKQRKNTCTLNKD